MQLWSPSSSGTNTNLTSFLKWECRCSTLWSTWLCTSQLAWGWYLLVVLNLVLIITKKVSYFGVFYCLISWWTSLYFVTIYWSFYRIDHKIACSHLALSLSQHLTEKKVPSIFVHLSPGLIHFLCCRYVDLLLGEFKHYKTRLAHGGIRKEVMTTNC